MAVCIQGSLQTWLGWVGLSARSVVQGAFGRAAHPPAVCRARLQQDGSQIAAGCTRASACSVRQPACCCQPDPCTLPPLLQSALSPAPRCFNCKLPPDSSPCRPTLAPRRLASPSPARRFVKKVIVYNKPEGGITAWLQFLDATTAAQVRLSVGIVNRREGFGHVP